MRILATGGTEGSGLAAELVPLDDPEAVAAGLRQAIASGARREEMRRMEAEHVSRFAWASTASQTLARYRTTPRGANRRAAAWTVRAVALTFDAVRMRLADAESGVFAYTMPIVVFALFTGMEGQLPQSWYPLLYLTKVCAVTLSLMLCRSVLADIRPSRHFVMPAAIVGGAVFAAWIGIDKWVPYLHLGTRVGFNPFASLAHPGVAAAFVVVRLYGLCLLVPVMEELFWRAFLLRYLTTTENFESMSVGAFSWSAFWLVAFFFAIAHPEWLPALVTACAYALLLRQTKSLFAVVVAHSVTNGALGIYIMLSHDWQYW